MNNTSSKDSELTEIEDLRHEVEQEVNALGLGADRAKMPENMGLLTPSLDFQHVINRLMAKFEAYHSQQVERAVVEATIEECRDIAETVAKNKQLLTKQLPLSAEDIENWVGRRLRNYIQNGTQDIVLAALKRKKS